MQTPPNLAQARQYLAKVVPWDTGGYVNLCWTQQSEGYDKPRWTGRAVRTLDDAIYQLKWGLSLDDTRDVFACMSAQREAHERVSQKGRKYYVPMRSQDNAIALKSLFLDVDVSEDPAKDCYRTRGEAITHLGKFIRDAALPQFSMIVSSGGGLHAYYTLDRALTKAEWEPLAYALREAAERHKLKCDVKITADAARVLRIPDTLNRKTDPPRPVRIAGKPADFDYSVEHIAKALEPYRVALPTLARTRSEIFVDPALFAGMQGASAAPIENELGAGVDLNMSREDMRACLDVIPNTTIDWNAWNAMGLRIYAACNGEDYGLEEWQRWSDKNTAAQANAQDTCKDRWATFHHTPPTRTGAGALVNEAKRATGSNNWRPVTHLSSTTPITQPSAGMAPALPAGFASQNGVICEVGVDETGQTKFTPICDYKMEDPWLQKNPWVLHFTTATEMNASQNVSIELNQIGTQGMRQVFQEQGVMLPVGAKKLETIARFLVAWVKQLQETKESVLSSPFGWQTQKVTGLLEGFVFGGQLWTPQGARSAAVPDSVLGRHYAPAGQQQPWHAAAKLITDQGRPELEALLATAFAAPLVRFTGHLGVIMSCYSTSSGIGKTTALKVAQAVWGDPVRAVQSLSDTQNAVMGKLGQIQSLPLYWDELKTEDDTKRFVNITFQVSQGKEKARMTQSVKQREPGSWQTLLVSASNDSLVDYVTGHTNTTTAGLYRIFEYYMDHPPAGAPGQIDTSEASLIVAKMHDNYGQVGLEYAKFLGEHHARIEQEVAAHTKLIGQELKAINDERFWVALVSVICLGARYANELKFTSINEEALKTFMFKQLGKMRDLRQTQTGDMDRELNVSNLLAQFISAMRSKHTLYTNRIHVSKGKPTVGSIKPRGDISRLDGIYVQVGVEDKLMRISSYKLGEWLSEKGYSRHVFTQALIREMGATKVVGRIGSGTGSVHLIGATEYLFQIDLAGTQFANFLDEV